ncbi:hypothetical protein CAPTEDRAFT_220448 [Capitella teleta]|uniref:ARID domain-containing protein n=1 Tax=Capitella teleta TaxID=283909 RepID=R7VBR2_CAPTE|nr:hypothetical protein CAPTEDRAFT_220448 [Capitella teleta]|eukprot:ELU13731.1 hypothetical protein CAPTEDRAFT_220448 [Capitella teleta]
MEAPKIQFSGGPCGQHGPYTFYKSFKYSKENKTRFLSLGEFFYVRVLEDAPICIGELQLLWLDKNQSEYQLCSLRLYFAPENTPDGRQPHHGKDEILAESEKVVLDLPHLLDWIVEGKVDWGHGSRTKCRPQVRSTSCSSLARVFTSSDCASKFREKDSAPAADAAHHDEASTDVLILSYAQYCRYRCVLRRFENCPNQWLKNAVISAIAGFVVQSARMRIMFCRDTIDHPLLEDHEFRLDHMVPLLKGRRRKKMSFKRDSGSEAYDSDRSVYDQSPDSVFKPSNNPAKPEPPTTPVSPPKKIAPQITQPVQPISAAVSQTQNSNPISAKIKPAKVSRPEEGKVNSAEEREFLEKLFAFMRNYHRPIERLPTLGFKEVDLYLFYGYAQRFGGYEQVTQNRQWKQIYDMLGGNPNNTSAATCTRRIYEKLLLPFERFTSGVRHKALPDPCDRPIHKQLISNMAGKCHQVEEKPIVKHEEKISRVKKTHKTVQEILNHQRNHGDSHGDEVFDSKEDVYISGHFPPERHAASLFPPERPSVIHPVPPKAEPEAHKRTFPFGDEPFSKTQPPHAHAPTEGGLPSPAKVPKPSDYIDQLRQAQQKTKSDPDENSAPLDLSMKASRPPPPSHPHALLIPKMEAKVERMNPSKQSAFKSIETLSASAQKPASSQPSPFSPSLPMPIVHPAFTHFASNGILPPSAQFAQPFLYPLSTEAGIQQVLPQFMYAQQPAAAAPGGGGAFLIPSIPLFPPQHPMNLPPVSKR